MLRTASFFGEKIVCLPGAKDADLYKLAQIYFKQRQFRRALQTVQKATCACSDNLFRLLSAQCLAECKDYDQCLAVLGDDEVQELQMSPEASPSAAGTQEDDVDTIAAMCLLRGHVYDMQQNRVKAAVWYQQAVRRDVKVIEAFERLVDSHMLTCQEQAALVASLRFGPDDLLLKAFYHGRLHKYALTFAHNDFCTFYLCYNKRARAHACTHECMHDRMHARARSPPPPPPPPHTLSLTHSLSW